MLESEDRKSKTRDQVFDDEIVTREGEFSKNSIEPKIDKQTPEVFEED